MTRKEFIKNYLAESGVSEQFRRRMFAVLPCHCKFQNCPGWAHVTRDKESIDNHFKRFVKTGGEIEGLDGAPEIDGLDGAPEIDGLDAPEIEGL